MPFRDCVVIGSGISGLSIANMLREQQINVQILEKEPAIGGLIKCETIDGNLFHRVGGHVFNSKNQWVLDWFWKHFDREAEFLPAKRNAKILLNNQLVGYPIENYLFQLPDEIAKQIVAELLAILEAGKGQRAYLHFQDFLVSNFGETLNEVYFNPYNSKIWNTDLTKVPLAWLDGKLPMPNIKAVISSNIVRQEETEMVHASFWYPKKNGSQFIIDRLSEGMDLKKGYRLERITWKDGKLHINNGDIISDRLVYCGDVRKLGSIISIPNSDLEMALRNVEALPSNGTSNVLCETDDTNLSWLYIPEKEFAAHRIIYTGNFSKNNNAKGKRKTCVVEFSGKHAHDSMVEELKKLPGNLAPLAFNYEPNSYIIQYSDTRKKIRLLKEQLAQYGIYLLGRFAEWEYYNMDMCIEKAMGLTDSLLNSQETLLDKG